MITLAKALKLKNSLVRDLQIIKMNIQRSNTRRSDQPERNNVNELDKQLRDLTVSLVKLKSRIVESSVKIQPAILELGEVKSLIEFYRTVPVREGEEVVGIGTNGKVYTWNSQWDSNMVDTKVKDLQSRIDKLQDDIDTHNATTKLDVSDLAI